MHLDLRHLGEKKINAKIPFVRELCMKYQNLDPVSDLIPVRPVVHYMMGGVHTDINGATPLPGLYAAGEVACVSINGANRLGSNSLPELLVFGARAGRAAAEYASRGRRHQPERHRAEDQDEQRRLEHDLLNKNGARAHRRAARRDAEDDGGERRHLSIGRVADAKACSSCASLQERYRRRRDRGSQPDVQHRADRRPGARVHARRRRGDRHRGARGAKNRAARTSAPISRSATISGFSRIR